jgi:hypothetical protein
MRRPCLSCGKLIDGGSYCAPHDPRPRRRRFNPARGSGGKAATFRRKTLALTGGRCAVCGSTDRVAAPPPGAGGRRPDAGGRRAAVPRLPRQGRAREARLGTLAIFELRRHEHARPNAFFTHGA